MSAGHIHVGRQVRWAVAADSKHSGRCVDTCPGSDDHQHWFALATPDEASHIQADNPKQEANATIAVNYLISNWVCKHCAQERRIAEPGLS